MTCKVLLASLKDYKILDMRVRRSVNPTCPSQRRHCPEDTCILMLRKCKANGASTRCSFPVLCCSAAYDATGDCRIKIPVSRNCTVLFFARLSRQAGGDSKDPSAVVTLLVCHLSLALFVCC